MFRPSLTLRLTLAFILLVAATSALVSVSLYRSLYTELVWRDNQTLVNRGAQLRQLLLDGAEPRSLPLYFNRMMNTRLDIVRIARPGQGIIVEVNQAGVTLPVMDEVPAGMTPSAALLHHWRTASGADAAGLTLRGADGQGDVMITVARLSEDREQVLARYRQHSLVISLTAILLAAIVSPLLIRRSLRAIRALSRQTARTDSQQLATPLALDTLPAELLPLGRSLNVMRQRLAEDFSRLTQFADDLAHELRTPVNILLGQTQVMLQQPRSSEEYQALLASNIEELEHLTRLIENILFLSRADHRNVALDRQPVALASFIASVVDFLEPLAEEREQQFVVEAEGDVLADRLLLQRLLTNLMTNALRHSPAGAQIRISATARDDEVTITVANPGEPIAEPEKIFTRFWRGDDARHTPGTGLGLALSQAIATLHRGTLSVSHRDGGNHFTLRMPRF
ncbi:heavy metal sensor histidine kinase [Siccibacter colletis]|uniref:heavy metal sensor histidine kinase n=1 Tax=Siccibacter colletis TaxID=1505757 RepID=UPI0028BD360B|nr:heavy metal sensor histidine kinase [Siccibacter colletis]WNN47266.1 heavy metal sensor histidine kinase [Siccibacter colletis]